MGNLSRTSSSWVRTSGSSGGCSGGCSSRDLVGGGSLSSAGSATRDASSGGSSSGGSSSSICSLSPGSNPLFFSRVCVPAAARGSMEAAGEVSSSLGADMPIATATTTASATAKSIMATPTLRSIYQPSSSPSGSAMGRPRSTSPQQAPLSTDGVVWEIPTLLYVLLPRQIAATRIVRRPAPRSTIPRTMTVLAREVPPVSGSGPLVGISSTTSPCGPVTGACSSGSPPALAEAPGVEASAPFSSALALTPEPSLYWSFSTA